MPVLTVDKITPAIVRTAIHAAVGRGIKFPGPDFEEFLAAFFNGLIEAEPRSHEHAT